MQVVLFGVYEVVRNGHSSGCDFEGLNYIVNATSSNLWDPSNKEGNSILSSDW